MTLRAVAQDEDPQEPVSQLAMFESKPIAQYLVSLQGIKEFVPVLAGEAIALHHGDRIVIEVEAEVEAVHIPEPRKAVKLSDGTRIRVPVGKLTRKHIAKANRSVLVSVEKAEPPGDLYGERREG